MDYIQIISVAGVGGIIGSIVTAIVQSWLATKQYIAGRNFQERKEAYVGLLEAYRAACKDSNEKNKNAFAYWSVRCELVAPKEMRVLIEEMKTSDNEKQYKAFQELKEIMRKNLGVES